MVRLDTAAAALVSVCDGGLTADQALVAIASLLGQDTDLVRASLMPVLAELVGYGLLVR